MFGNAIVLAGRSISPSLMDYSIFGGLVAFFSALLWLGILIGILLYIYTSLTLYTIGKKLKYKYSWLAWIPGANIAMLLQIGGFHWALVFLLLIPILGWIAVAVLGYIALWRIYEKRKYPGWLSLVSIASIIPFLGIAAMLAHLIIIGIVAWKDK